MNTTPIKGHLNLKIGKYKDKETFLLAPLDGCDVILGMPWHFRTHPIPDYVEKTLSFNFEGKPYVINADVGDWQIPIVKNHIAVKRACFRLHDFCKREE